MPEQEEVRLAQEYIRLLASLRSVALTAFFRVQPSSLIAWSVVYRLTHSS